MCSRILGGYRVHWNHLRLEDILLQISMIIEHLLRLCGCFGGRLTSARMLFHVSRVLGHPQSRSSFTINRKLIENPGNFEI